MLHSLKTQNFNCLTDYALETLNSVNLDKIESFFGELPADFYIERNYRFRQLSTEPVGINDVPGEHIRIMSEPLVQILAKKLKVCIEQSQKVQNLPQLQTC